MFQSLCKPFPWLLRNRFRSAQLCKHVSVYKINKPFRGCFIFIGEITQASRKQHGSSQQVGTRKKQDGSGVSQRCCGGGRSCHGSCWAPAEGLMPWTPPGRQPSRTLAAAGLCSGATLRRLPPPYSSQKMHATTTGHVFPCFPLVFPLTFTLHPRNSPGTQSAVHLFGHPQPQSLQ